jgi:trehalose 6-phosphate phosphatase
MTMEAQATSLPPPEPVDVSTTSLLLDFDGTLVPIEDDPHSVVVDDALLALLGRLHGCFAGRIAIVSGRSIAQLDALLGPIAGKLALSGSHGTEHRWNGVSAQPVRPVALDDIAARFGAFAQAHPGTLVEDKSFGVALHYRRAPEQAAAVNALAALLAAEHGLIFQPGAMLAEIRMAGSDKGIAVARLMQRTPMAGTMPIFLGDDDTDEHAFCAVTALGGVAVAVGPRPSVHARFALRDPGAVRLWLREIAA